MNASPASPSSSAASQALYLPDNASLFTRLRVALKALKVLKGDEGNPTAGQMINDCLDREVYAALVQKLKSSEEGRRLLSTRPSLQSKDIDLDALARLPEGTLGHEFARYFRDHKISPFETTIELKSDIDFIGKRYRETHDLLHLLTGYGTDVMGEMEVQAFALGNLGIRTAALILVVGVIGQLKDRHAGVNLDEYVRRVWAAYQRGRASQPFLSYWFERHWETPVTTLCTQVFVQQPIRAEAARQV